MSSFDPGYGETQVSEDEREALTPYALSVLGDPPLKSDLYDVEQTLQDHLGGKLVNQIRSGSLGLDDDWVPWRQSTRTRGRQSREFGWLSSPTVSVMWMDASGVTPGVTWSWHAFSRCRSRPARLQRC